MQKVKLITIFPVIFLVFLSLGVNAQLTQYNIGGPGYELATKIKYFPSDGSSIIAGYSYDIVSGVVSNSQIIVMKVTASGTIAWQKTFGVTGQCNTLYDMIITSDNNIVLVGCVGYPAGSTVGNTAAIVKYNSTTGNLMWQNCFRDAATTAGGEFFMGVTELADGSGRLIAVGAHNYTPAGNGGMICVFQSNGTLIYDEVDDIASGDEYRSVVSSVTGDSVYICGDFVGTAYKDGRVISYTPGTTSGTINWAKYYNYSALGTESNNFFVGISLSGSKLLIKTNDFIDYSYTGGSASSIVSINAADGSGAQIRTIQNSGAAYYNSAAIAAVSFDHVFTAQSPANTSYDPALVATGVITNSVITEITSLASSTANAPVKFTSSTVGEHSIMDMNIQGSTLYMAGGTNITTGFGNNDIYYVSSGTGLSSLNLTCDTAHDVVSITSPAYTSTTPAYSVYSFTPAYSTVDTGSTSYNISIICGDIPSACNVLTLSPDTLHTCAGNIDTLHATLTGIDSVLSIAWSPAAGLSDTSTLDPVLTAGSPGWYYLTVESLLPENLVINGNFSAGNTGFVSPDYTYSVAVPYSNYYTISTDIFLADPGFPFHFYDHTNPPTGLMMVVNGGSPASNTIAWQETVPVTAGDMYDFIAWYAYWTFDPSGASNPQLYVTITPSGGSAGPSSYTFTPLTSDDTWSKASYIWTAPPGATSATLSIIDQNSGYDYNDFCLDDISFQPICTVKDSIYISVTAPDTTYTHKDTTACASLSGITLASPTGYTSQVWSTGVTTDTITISTTGSYWVVETGSCTLLADTFHVTFKPLPVINLGNDTGFCQGDSLILTSLQPDGSTYLWSTGSTGDSIHILTSGTYWLTVNNGCTATDSIQVTIAPAPAVNLGPDTTQCQGNPVTLQSSITYSSPIYLWSTGSTMSSIIANTSGTYWLQVTNNGCPGSDTVHVSIVYDTLDFYNHDTAICRGADVQVITTGNAAITYQWLPTTGIPFSNSPSPLITADTSAMYVLHASFTGCTDIIDSFYIDVQPNPVVYIGNDRSVCDFDTLHFNAWVTPGWYSHYIYSWTPPISLDNPAAPSVVFTAGDSTELILTVTTPAGCTGTDSVQITVHPANFATISNDISICPHDSVQLIATNAATYYWSPPLYISDSTSATPWVHPITSQDYTLFATSQFGCLDTLHLAITVYPAAVIYLGDSITLYPGQPYEIPTQTNCTIFSWFPPVGLSNSNIPNPIASPNINTDYIVTGTTEWGCIATDSINIFVDPQSVLALPNAFTPGNGPNNILYILKRGEATLNYFRIYNRWGNKVYESSNIDAGWDGTYNGTPQPYDVYVYEIQAVTSTGQLFEKHGNVTLIR